MLTKMGNGVLGAVGITAGGIFVILYLAIGLAIYVGGITFIYWLSYVFYDAGLWPLGMIARIVSFMMLVGLGLGVLSMGLMGLAGLVALITSSFRREGDDN